MGNCEVFTEEERQVASVIDQAFAEWRKTQLPDPEMVGISDMPTELLARAVIVATKAKSQADAADLTDVQLAAALVARAGKAGVACLAAQKQSPIDFDAAIYQAAFRQDLLNLGADLNPAVAVEGAHPRKPPK